MNAQITSISELASLKARLKATWMSGDFDKIAQIIAAGGAEFIARLELRPGARVLDVACGTGNLSFPAARGRRRDRRGYCAEPAGNGARARASRRRSNPI